MLQNNEKLSLHKIFIETNGNLGLIRKRHVVSFILQQLATRLGHPLKSKPRTKTSLNKTIFSADANHPQLPTPPPTQKHKKKKQNGQQARTPKAPKQIRLETQRRRQDQRNGIATNNRISHS